jgi:presenilin-like A22 family membrane protease
MGSLLFGVICALLIKSMEPLPVTPFPEGAGSVANAIYFVVAVSVGASVLYVLVRRKNRKLITLIIGFALTAAVFMLSFIYLLIAFSIIAFPFPELAAFVSSVPLTILADLAIFRNHETARNITVLGLGGALGTFLGWSIPLLSAVLILLFLAVYDTFAVYRGPVGKIAKAGLDQLRGLSFSFKDMQMGLGDLTFYSMLSGMFASIDYLSWFASIIGILVGCLLSFKMLERKGIFPGLPFPILFGLAAGFAVYVLV